MMTVTQITRSRLGMRHVMLAVLCGLLVLCGGAAPAGAATGGPVLNVTQQVRPTQFVPGKTALYAVVVTNIGGAASTDPVTITDTLPTGVTYAGMSDFFGVWSCSAVPGDSVVQCTLNQGLAPGGESQALTLQVEVAAGASGAGENVIVLSGPGEISDTSRASTVFSTATAPFGLAGFEAWGVDGLGAAAHRAGSHPDLTTTISLNTNRSPNGGAALAGDLKQATVDLPPGLIGNPTAVPTCAPEDLANVLVGATCAPETQVGTVALTNSYDAPFAIRGARTPVFNIAPPVGAPARFGFNNAGVVTLITPVVRTGGDYGVTAKVDGASQTLAVTDTTLTLWGVPADRSHDAMRRNGGPSTWPARPFFTLPTSCTGVPVVTRLSVSSWQRPSEVLSASTSSDFNGQPVMNDGCDELAFDPTVAVVPSTIDPDAPTGLKVTIDSPQNLDNPVGLASAHLRNVKVTLPDGMTINPGSADGLGACSDEQLGLSNDQDAACPESAKIGTVTATTPLLKEALSGGVYIRTQASNDPESGDMFRMALVLENKERGVLVKLGGAIKVNKDTGRIVTEFDNNPQLPVEHIELTLKSGPRAPLANPASCGAKNVETQFTSWAGHTVNATSSFGVSCTDGLGGFSPSLKAGTKNALGGAFSPLGLTIAKPDGNADLAGLSMSLPAGLLAKLKGNVGTQVGSVTVYAGPGAAPFALPGKVFLEGAYGDAPFSMRVVVPAKAGPFDLGTVEVRQKIYVDPITAQVTVVSDPLPTVVKGVPVRLQRLEVNVDKPGFVINPTSCAAKSFGGTLNAAGGQTAPIDVRFQVGSCGDLALKPSLALSLSGKGQTTDGKHPAVSANLTQPAGQANLKKVRVTLPLSLALDPDNAASDGLCSFVEGSKPDPKCPASSVVGKATAVTPILDEPLSGPVYFVKNERKDPKSGRSIRTTPKLVIPLTGQNGVKLTLTGTSDVVDDRLVTTFDNIPDAPVSSFKMDIIGGKKGILVISGDKADICKSAQIADQQIDGQNNKQADTDVSIQTPSCPLKVLSKKIGKRSVVVKVGGLGAGKVTITGRGIKKTTKTITKSTVATITAKRTKATPGKVTVSYDPAGPAKARKTTK